MKKAIALCLLLAAGCVGPRQVVPLYVDATLTPVVCPAGQIALIPVGYDNVPMVHDVVTVLPNGETHHNLVECNHE